jgi:hypothetical protein
MNGAFVPFVPEPVHHAKPSPEVAAKLAELRAQALARAKDQQRKAPHVFRPVVG